MGRIIAVANQKGGVGKTTTTINLSSCLAEIGKRVLTIDTDPQGNTTSGLGVEKDELENTVYELMLDECTIRECIVKTEVENLDLIPSNVNLAGAEIELMGINDKEYILRNAVDYIKDDYDYIVIASDSHFREIYVQLTNMMGVSEKKILVYDQFILACSFDDE